MNSISQNDLQSATASSILLENWRRVTALTCLGVVLSMIVLLLVPKKYESQMKLLVKNEREDLVVSTESNPTTLHQQTLSEEQLNSEVELLGSLSILQQVVLNSKLTHYETGTVQADGQPSALALEKATQKLQRDLSIEPVRKSNIISVSYSARTPALATTVLKQLADTYLEEHLRVHNTPGTYSFFKKEADNYQRELAESELALRTFREQHSLIVMPQEQDVLTQRMVEAQAAFEEADAAVEQCKARLRQANSILPNIDGRITTMSRAVPNPMLVQQLTTMLADLRNRRTEMAVKYRPEDRLVQQLDEEVAQTESALKQAVDTTQTELTTDVNVVRQNADKDKLSDEIALPGLEARRRNAEEALNRYQIQTHSLAGATVEHDSLVRTVKENEENYLLYAKKREEARITELLDQQRIANVALAEAPTSPVEPSFPKMTVAIPLAILLSIFLSVAIVLGREFMRLRELPVAGLPVPSVVSE